MKLMSKDDRDAFEEVREALCKAVRDSDDTELKHYYHRIIKQMDKDIGFRMKLERAYREAKKREAA